MRWQAAHPRPPQLDVSVAKARDVVTRGMLFSGVTGVGFLNAVSEKSYLAYLRDGPMLFALNTFDLSAIIWAAIIISLHDLWSIERGIPAGFRDKVVAGVAIVMILTPVPALSTCAISLIGAYIWRTAKGDMRTRSVGALLFAVTIPLLWARLIFAAFSDTLLAFDAKLVAWVVGTEPYANIVPYPDGSGGMFFGPGCSSFTNISLAILCSALFAHAFGKKWSREIWLWALFSALTVLAINVGRISLIGFYPNQYELIHGAVGTTLFGWITVGLLLGVGLHGVGRVRTV
jgi:exosortase/archaeosortase family protein